ncbi:hypothetical protein Rcae01_01365 [Novipirellula caenicola]|uniref:Uncharacterized protein n=1 Tax=Novipirellula caenicola TaxID=1536901 RepID=A0ABP9VMV1_9BACT
MVCGVLWALERPKKSLTPSFNPASAPGGSVVNPAMITNAMIMDAMIMDDRELRNA